MQIKYSINEHILGLDFFFFQFSTELDNLEGGGGDAKHGSAQVAQR